MSALVKRLGRSAIAPVLVAAVVASFLMADSPVAKADGDIVISGHGFGHGRGMSQYGSYGYAVERGADYRAILDHYYRGTNLYGDAGNPIITVELLGMRGMETVITGPDLALNGVPLGRGAVRMRGVASNTIEVLVGDTCAGPWSLWTGTPNGLVGSGVNASGELRLCEAGGIRAYRGHLTVLDGGGFQTTVNRVHLDDYLRGVLPREMPAGWGSAGGGRGMEALKVQAVAARSYALSSQWESYANTCDTTSCQVYAGGYTQPFGGAVKWIEDGRTDNAVAATTGQVRRKSNGAIARTEFNSSSGGWTAGGDFPAVEDLGDSTSINPNRDWTVTLSRATVAARLGIAPITGVQVTQRNGLGADGGRVLKVAFNTTVGQQTFTGNQVRAALGLKSDWFSLNTISTAQARAFTQALYADVLGRAGDPGGIDYWSGGLIGGADPYNVAYAFANSTERYRQMVYAAYVHGLNRGPDPGGANTWLNLLLRGGTLNDLNAAIFGSQESLNTLGRGDVRTWVDGVYKALLGRSASQDERTGWANHAAQVGRPAVAMTISQSVEACNKRLGEYYFYLLGRAIDPGGRSTYSGSLAGRGDVDVVAIIGSSAEYRQRAESRFP
jgi:SpoIID/LytB domain protein